MTSPDNPFAGFFSTPNPTDSVALAANRVGELTPEQKKQIQGRLLPRLAGSLVGAIVFLPILFCFSTFMLGSLSAEDVWVALVPLGIMLVLFGAMTLWAVITGARPALALLDVMAGRVDQIDGRLAWHGQEYRGVAEGRTLRLLPGAELMPGGYRFYYLPRSGYVASAERLFLGGTEAEAQAELRRALQDVFNFADDDLPENQTGRLSARQTAAQLWAAARSGLALSPFLLMALFFAVGFPLLFFTQSDGLSNEDWIGLLIGGGLGLIFFLVLAGIILAPFLDVFRGEVQSVEGEVEERAITTGSGKNRRTNYYYVVNDQRFNVGQRGHQALIQGRRYRLYFFPRSKRVVSVEPLFN
jgi:hypothetical protein